MEFVRVLSTIEGLMRAGKPVAASVAPSFLAAFPDVRPGQVLAGMLELGFVRVEETASILPEMYSKLEAEVSRDVTRISTSCPLIVNLVRRRYPSLQPLLAAQPSAMALHAARLKEDVGSDSLVVFIGPCRHKAKERGGAVDFILTFPQLGSWLGKRGISLASLEPRSLSADIPDWARLSVLVEGVSGLDRCRRFLDALTSRALPGFHELTACRGGCIGGPDMGIGGDISDRTKAVFDAVWGSRDVWRCSREDHGKVLSLQSEPQRNVRHAAGGRGGAR